MPKRFYPNDGGSRVLIPDREAWRGYTDGLFETNQRVDLPIRPSKFPVVVNEEHGMGWCGTRAVRISVVEEAYAADLPQYQLVFDGQEYVPAEK